ncbi:MAG: hypothetical protein ACPHRO_05315 [Nannocystaceae bacterium]
MNPAILGDAADLQPFVRRGSGPLAFGESESGQRHGRGAGGWSGGDQRLLAPRP